MANIALGLELDLHRREPLLLRWYRAHSSTLRGLLSLLIVGLVWEIAGRSGRWPLILAPISDIWVKFVQLAATGELGRHILVSLNEFFVGFAVAAVFGILLGVAIAKKTMGGSDVGAQAVYNLHVVSKAVSQNVRINEKYMQQFVENQRRAGTANLPTDAMKYVDNSLVARVLNA